MIKKKENTNNDNCFSYNIQKCINLLRWITRASFAFIQGCCRHNQSCKAWNHFQRGAQQQSAGHNEWTNSQSAGKVAGLTNRSFITAKTISVSHTISARAPGGASTARSRRLSAPGSVQDQNRPVTALSLHCSTPGQVCFQGGESHDRVPEHMTKQNWI